MSDTFQLSPEDLALITSRPTSDVREWARPLTEVMRRYDIASFLRASHFLAQLLHESAGLRHTVEIWGPTGWQERYEGRRDLGNTEPGDGYRYRGRGLIQLTGRANYEAYNEDVEPDVVEHPELVAELPLSADVAGWYWDRHDLNELADRDDTVAITKAINGGTNGLSDRREWLAKAKIVLRGRPHKMIAKDLRELGTDDRTNGTSQAA